METAGNSHHDVDARTPGDSDDLDEFGQFGRLRRLNIPRPIPRSRRA
jgi:hypothetical protein